MHNTCSVHSHGSEIEQSSKHELSHQIHAQVIPSCLLSSYHIVFMYSDCATAPPSSLTDNAKWSSCAGTKHGNTCMGSCNDGYMFQIAEKPPVALCEDGVWSLHDATSGACVGECDAAIRLLTLLQLIASVGYCWSTGLS